MTWSPGDKVSKTGKGRNKLHVLEKKHRKNGNNKKTNNEYIALIENYFIPFFGKYNIYLI